jgi:hypothetical protein
VTLPRFDSTVHLVALEQVFVGEGLESVHPFPFVTVVGVVAKDTISRKVDTSTR